MSLQNDILNQKIEKIFYMKFGVVVFPGSNCDDDMVHVLGTVMGQEVRKLWHKDSNLPDDFSKKDCIVLPGGFSFGDYLRSGAIAKVSPIMESVIKHANNGGYVLGICNGFQVLCESGLLPGVLLRNLNEKFICKNIHLATATTKSDITSNIPEGKVLKIPIAHADGRFFCDEETLKNLKKNDQILFRYCDEAGNVNEDANPNGSVDNIAGICNEGRNVFGMMPHPERAAEDIVANCDGKVMFESLLKKVLA